MTTQNYEKDVEVLKKHLKTKLWRSVPEQQNKWIALITDLCQLHSKALPSGLTIDPQGRPYYDNLTHRIILNKYSVISLLHELAHHFWGHNETLAVNYSETVFLTAYKPAQKNLVRDKRGWLVKRDTPATAGGGN